MIKVQPAGSRGKRVASKVRATCGIAYTYAICKELHVSIHNSFVCQRFLENCLALNVQLDICVNQPKLR